MPEMSRLSKQFDHATFFTVPDPPTPPPLKPSIILDKKVLKHHTETSRSRLKTWKKKKGQQESHFTQPNEVVRYLLEITGVVDPDWSWIQWGPWIGTVPDPGGQKLPRKTEKGNKFHLLKCRIFLFYFSIFGYQTPGSGSLSDPDPNTDPDSMNQDPQTPEITEPGARVVGQPLLLAPA
jgi:hypothetical protein